jgi:hypothetical protein
LPCSQHWRGSPLSDGWWSRLSAFGDMTSQSGRPLGPASCCRLPSPIAELCQSMLAIPRLAIPRLAIHVRSGEQAPSHASCVRTSRPSAQHAIAQYAMRGALSLAWVCAVRPH